MLAHATKNWFMLSVRASVVYIETRRARQKYGAYFQVIQFARKETHTLYFTTPNPDKPIIDIRVEVGCFLYKTF